MLFLFRSRFQGGFQVGIAPRLELEANFSLQPGKTDAPVEIYQWTEPGEYGRI
jgi:hypothetical protein